MRAPGLTVICTLKRGDEHGHEKENSDEDDRAQDARLPDGRVRAPQQCAQGGPGFEFGKKVGLGLGCGFGACKIP